MRRSSPPSSATFQPSVLGNAARRETHTKSHEKATWFAAASHEANVLHAHPHERNPRSFPSVGKTCFCRALAKVFGLSPTLVRLLDPTQLPLITEEYFLDRLFGGGSVILDDVGSEHQVNEYGIIYEPVSDFIARWYDKFEKRLSIGNLLVVNTDLNADHFAGPASSIGRLVD